MDEETLVDRMKTKLDNFENTVDILSSINEAGEFSRDSLIVSDLILSCSSVADASS